MTIWDLFNSKIVSGVTVLGAFIIINELYFLFRTQFLITVIGSCNNKRCSILFMSKEALLEKNGRYVNKKKI